MEFDDQQMMEIALLENIQREDLNAIEEAKAYAEDEYRKLHGVESSCYVEEIGWLDYFYRRMMKREVAEQMGIRIRPFTLWNH